MRRLAVVAAAEHLAALIDPGEGLAVARAAHRCRTARAVLSSRRAINARSPSHPSPVRADSATTSSLRWVWLTSASRDSSSSRSILLSTSISPSSTSWPRPSSRQHRQHVGALRGAVRVMGVADMDDDVGLGDLFQRRAERGDQMRRQVGDEADRVGEDRRSCRTADSSRRIVGSRVANSMSSAPTADAGQAVEQGRLAGVGVADQRHHRVRHALARLAVQRAGAFHLFELALQLGDALADQAAVDFDLAFAGAAEEAEAAALAFQVGPGPHQPRALIGERRQFDLQPAFMGAGARAEDFEDQAGAVDDLGLPLRVRDCAAAPATASPSTTTRPIFFSAIGLAERFDPAFADQRRRHRPVERERSRRRRHRD